VNKNLIVRFQEKDITWVSGTLFRTRKRYLFGFPFCFKKSYDKIWTFFKRPVHFESKARYILSEIFNQNVGKLIWDATTGYINVETSNSFIFANIAYLDPDLPTNKRHREQKNYFFGIHISFISKAALEKHLKILELLGLLEILSTTQKTKRVKLCLDKCNEFLKAGTEEQISLNKIYNLGWYEYGRA